MQLLREKSMQQEEKRHQSFPLRLAPSTRQQANDLAQSEGISLNHFISIAVAEKIGRMEQASLRNEQQRLKQPSVSGAQTSPRKPV
jgi:hypothetical protein